MGLGPLALVPLKEARELALKHRRELRLEGADPIEKRRAERARSRLGAAKAVTFKGCGERYIAAHRHGWKNDKHAAQWPSTLEAYVYPILGALPIQAIDTGLVMQVFEQEIARGKGEKPASLWIARPVTAGRVRGRIEAIIDYAAARGWREGENPARWRGHLENLLPKKSKVRQVEHHAALAFAELPGFAETLRRQNGIAARALEFTILCAARTGEALGASWEEINFLDKTWTIPAGRMKAGREHRVPLADRAIAILTEQRACAGEQDCGFIFPGGKPGRPLSNMALLVLLRRMERPDLTTHGFRSSFRDWAAERTSFQNEVVEMALAHIVGSKVEQAYLRTDLFAKRRRLMAAWSEYCDGKPAIGAVFPLRAEA